MPGFSGLQSEPGFFDVASAIGPSSTLRRGRFGGASTTLRSRAGREQWSADECLHWCEEGVAGVRTAPTDRIAGRSISESVLGSSRLPSLQSKLPTHGPDRTPAAARRQDARIQTRPDVPNGLLRSLVAFANTSGGTVLVGVEDGTRHVLGVPEPLPAEERVANLIADRVSPQLLPDIELLRHRDRLVLAVRMHPSPGRPHYLGGTPETGTYVRVGSRNRRADSDLIAEMRRFARGESFDQQPVPQMDSEAIDFRAASESFSEFRKLADRDLDTLGLRTMYQGRRVPTVGGTLLFGRDRLAHFPDAWIQAGRFAGVDKARILDRAYLTMPLPDAVPAAVAFIERHMAAGVDIGAVRATPRWTLPPVAVREALVNTVAHADYSQRGASLRVSVFDDRLEVENPGLLPFGLTLDDLPRGVSKLRNRVIGRVFHELRLVEQWGSGVQRMLSACREAELPAPVWEEIGNRLRVTMRTRVHESEFVRDAAGESPVSPTRPAFGDTDRTILDLLDMLGGLSTHEIIKQQFSF